MSVREFFESLGWSVTRFDDTDDLEVWCLDDDGEGRVFCLARDYVAELDRDLLCSQGERRELGRYVAGLAGLRAAVA